MNKSRAANSAESAKDLTQLEVEGSLAGTEPEVQVAAERPAREEA